MYLTTFKLKEAPFQANPNAAYLYLSKSHARAKAYLESAVAADDEFVVITGEEGTGKTLLADTFRHELGKGALVAHLSHAPISTNEFLQALLEQFGFIPFRGNRAALVSTLKNYLGEQRAAGRKVLLLIDEAESLTLPLLEQLQELLNGSSGQPSAMRVILIGRPALQRLLDTPELAPLAQRARLRFQLSALAPDQTQGYIVHRLAIAGSQGRDIFQADCFAPIDRYAGGAPRLVNALCEAALRLADAAQQDSVRPENIEAAARELQLAPLPDRPEHQQTIPPAQAATPAAPPPVAAPAPAEREPPRPPPPERDLAPLAKDLVGARIGRLRVMHGGQLVVEYPLHIGRMMIGRAQDADLQIDDRTISRHHCQIISNQFLSVIQDLNSTNGVYVRDQRQRRHSLSDGDVFVLGSFQVAYVDERESEESGEVEEIADLPPPPPRAVDGESTQN